MIEVSNFYNRELMQKLDNLIVTITNKHNVISKKKQSEQIISNLPTRVENLNKRFIS